MAILKVARLGHPVLRQAAERVPVDAIGSPGVQALIADLLETVDEYDGAGLAAPQVHVPLRVVVLRLGAEPAPRVWVNPVVTALTGELAFSWEGCLSVPGMRGRVGRPAEIEVRAWERDGSEVGFRLGGHPAVVAQHECDHLDGVLFVDKCDPRSLAFLEEYRRFAASFSTDEDEPLTEEEDA